MSDAFTKLLKFDSKRNLLIEFFSTHPHTILRQKKFHLQAENWLNQHMGEKVYIGKRNLKEHQARCCSSYDEEYEIAEKLMTNERQ